MLDPAMVFSFVLSLSAPVEQEAAPRVLIPQPATEIDSAGIYQELRSLDTRARGQRLAELPGATKAGVWSHHLLNAPAEHPDFTNEQRAVIRDALSLLTAEFFEVDSADPRWGPAVDQPPRRLKQRAVGVSTGRAWVRSTAPTSTLSAGSRTRAAALSVNMPVTACATHDPRDSAIALRSAALRRTTTCFALSAESTVIA